MMMQMLESFKKNKVGITLMLFSSIFACIGQLFWKLSTTEGMVLLIIGFLFYGIGAIVMIIAYKFGSLSVLQPVLSMNYVLSLFLGCLVLNEVISIFKVAGVIIIILGVCFIGGGDE